MSSYHILLDTSSIKRFDHFIEECKTGNIALVLVYTPEYIEGQKFVKNRSEIIGLFKKIAITHDLLFFDYSNSPLSYERKNFYNASHLNAAGADSYSKILASDLKTIISKNLQKSLKKREE
jgi:hypothetical protein